MISRVGKLAGRSLPATKLSDLAKFLLVPSPAGE
jgi:hypothetical protein